MMAHVAHYPFVSSTRRSPLPPPSSCLLAAATRHHRGPSPPSISGSSGSARRTGLDLRHRWRGSSPPSTSGASAGRSGIVLQAQHTDSNATSPHLQHGSRRASPAAYRSANVASPPSKSAVLHRVRRFPSLQRRKPPHRPDQLDLDTPLIQKRIQSSTSSTPSPRIQEVTVPWLLHEVAIVVSFLSTQQPVSGLLLHGSAPPPPFPFMMCKSMCQEYRAWDLGIMSGVRTRDLKHSEVTLSFTQIC